jgi:uncharacterized protein
MYKRILKKPLLSSKSFFLFGPRGVGKTTWLNTHLTKTLYLDLLRPEIYSILITHPERIRSLIESDKNASIVIIDEIQKIPRLLDEVHRLIETEKRQFILTGSSARKIRQAGVNLLAGRAIQYYMYPLTALELAERFNLKTSLEFGHLPSIYNEDDPKAYLQTYVDTYIREEVIQEGIIRNVIGFRKFLEIASFSQGSQINTSAIATETCLDRKTVENYFSILEDLLISYQLPIFTKRAKRRLIKHTKFYFFDVGVYKAIRPHGFLDSPTEIAGIGLETLVFQELRATLAYYLLDYDLYYWRTTSGTEVDFVLYGKAGLIAIEVKHSAILRAKDFNGLKSFQQDYPEAKCYLFYTGTIKEVRHNITIIPAKEALLCLKTLL